MSYLTYNGKMVQSNNKFATYVVPQETIMDYDGNIYNVVTIGSQKWTVQNFRCTNYNNGTPIPNIDGSTAWLADTTGARCEYDNSVGVYANPYGYLYNHAAVMNINGIAPTGWKVPSKADIDALLLYVDPLYTPNYSDVAGGYLKEAGLTHWNTPNEGAINSYGFSFVGSGGRNTGGNYFGLKLFGNCWTTTTNGMFPSERYLLSMSYDWTDGQAGSAGATSGIPIRLIKI